MLTEERRKRIAHILKSESSVQVDKLSQDFDVSLATIRRDLAAMEKEGLLRRVYGYESFRPGQEELIDAVLHKHDVFGIMPTGGGKSMCYQLPGLMLPGITLVVSPLISLMRDQVLA